jgi:hypothetical protein
MNRFQLLGIWLLCTIFMPLMWLVMLYDALLGSPARAKNMEIATDEEGNAMFGGPPQQTISERTGNALITGERWAHFVAPVIDLFFGKGHCLANATVKAR